MGAGADDEVGPRALAAALDELIVAASALVVGLGGAGEPREQHIAAQLAAALLALATARSGLASALDETPSGPRLFAGRPPIVADSPTDGLV